MHCNALCFVVHYFKCNAGEVYSRNVLNCLIWTLITFAPRVDLAVQTRLAAAGWASGPSNTHYAAQLARVVYVSTRPN